MKTYMMKQIRPGWWQLLNDEGKQMTPEYPFAKKESAYLWAEKYMRYCSENVNIIICDEINHDAS